MKHLALWISIAAIGTYAMGSVTNHFFSKDFKNQGAPVAGSASTPRGDGSARLGIWWNPVTNSIDTSSKDPGATFESAPASSSLGNSIIPMDRSGVFSSGSLTVNDAVPIGSNSSREAYAVLGLGTKSFTGSASTLSIGSSNLNSSELHFSMGGDLNLVPVDNLATGGLSVVTFAAVPEPSTMGLLTMALSGFAFRRRRKPLANV
ncbi:MAG TPA: PEP-CTERM sorting domain-containing protein [Chthoniobacter sp.]|nr:PEP-CTERM sorting domain-containing protein [Chthoniobacter sp.]